MLVFRSSCFEVVKEAVAQTGLGPSILRMEDTIADSHHSWYDVFRLSENWRLFVGANRDWTRRKGSSDYVKRYFDRATSQIQLRWDGEGQPPEPPGYQREWRAALSEADAPQIIVRDIKNALLLHATLEEV